MYQNVTEGKFVFFDKEVLKSPQFYFLEPGVYPSITDIVSQLKCLEELKKLRITWQRRI